MTLLSPLDLFTAHPFLPLFSIHSVGALVALLREFKWERITILSTDTVYAKGAVNEFQRLWVGEHDGWTGEVPKSETIDINADGTDRPLQIQAIHHP